MTILVTDVEPQYTAYGHLIAFKITLTNKVNENRKVDVTIDITHKDADSKSDTTSKVEQKGVELRGLEEKVADISIETPLLVKDGSSNSWKIQIAEKKS
jgi:hypothetical protein